MRFKFLIYIKVQFHRIIHFSFGFMEFTKWFTSSLVVVCSEYKPEKDKDDHLIGRLSPLVNRLQETCQFHQVADFLQLV